MDLWSNEHIRADPHYTQADGASEFMSHHQARARQIEENIKIIDTADIGEVFMKNMWEHRATASKPGVVPLKMSTVEGIELLAKAGIVPEAIYVDASHHYKDVIQELTLCLKYFPDAAVCGDDWDCEPRPPALAPAALPIGPEPATMACRQTRPWLELPKRWPTATICASTRKVASAGRSSASTATTCAVPETFTTCVRLGIRTTPRMH